MTDSTTTPALDLAEIDRTLGDIDSSKGQLVGCGISMMREIERLREDVAKLKAAPLEWTKEKPKVEGWYWHRTMPGYVHEPLGVLHDKGVLRYWNVVEECFYDLPPGEWAGPMLEPKP